MWGTQMKICEAVASEKDVTNVVTSSEQENKSKCFPFVNSDWLHTFDHSSDSSELKEMPVYGGFLYCCILLLLITELIKIQSSIPTHHQCHQSTNSYGNELLRHMEIRVSLFKTIIFEFWQVYLHRMGLKPKYLFQDNISPVQAPGQYYILWNWSIY